MDDFGVSLGHFWRMKVTLGQLGVTLSSLLAIEGSFWVTLALFGIAFRI